MRISKLLALGFAALAVGVVVPAPAQPGEVNDVSLAAGTTTALALSNAEIASDPSADVRCGCDPGSHCEWCKHGHLRHLCCIRDGSLETDASAIEPAASVVKRNDPAPSHDVGLPSDPPANVACIKWCFPGYHCADCHWGKWHFNCCKKGRGEQEISAVEGALETDSSTIKSAAAVKRDDAIPSHDAELASDPPVVARCPKCPKGTHCEDCYLRLKCCKKDLGEQEVSTVDGAMDTEVSSTQHATAVAERGDTTISHDIELGSGPSMNNICFKCAPGHCCGLCGQMPCCKPIHAEETDIHEMSKAAAGVNKRDDTTFNDIVLVSELPYKAPCFLKCMPGRHCVYCDNDKPCCKPWHAEELDISPTEHAAAVIERDDTTTPVLDLDQPLFSCHPKCLPYQICIHRCNTEGCKPYCQNPRSLQSINDINPRGSQGTQELSTRAGNSVPAPADFNMPVEDQFCIHYNEISCEERGQVCWAHFHNDDYQYFYCANPPTTEAIDSSPVAAPANDLSTRANDASPWANDPHGLPVNLDWCNPRCGDGQECYLWLRDASYTYCAAKSRVIETAPIANDLGTRDEQRTADGIVDSNKCGSCAAGQKCWEFMFSGVVFHYCK